MKIFQFNTSFIGVLTNLVHGEQCARYQVGLYVCVLGLKNVLITWAIQLW